MVDIDDPVLGMPIGMVYNVQATKGTDWQLYRTASGAYNLLKADRESFYPLEEHPHLGLFSENDTSTTLQAQIDVFSALANP